MRTGAIRPCPASSSKVWSARGPFEDQLRARLGEGSEQAVMTCFELLHGDHVPLRVQGVPAHVVDPYEDRGMRFGALPELRHPGKGITHGFCASRPPTSGFLFV